MEVETDAFVAWKLQQNSSLEKSNSLCSWLSSLIEGFEIAKIQDWAYLNLYLLRIEEKYDIHCALKQESIEGFVEMSRNLDLSLSLGDILDINSYVIDSLIELRKMVQSKVKTQEIKVELPAVVVKNQESNNILIEPPSPFKIPSGKTEKKRKHSSSVVDEKADENRSTGNLGGADLRSSSETISKKQKFTNDKPQNVKRESLVTPSPQTKKGRPKAREKSPEREVSAHPTIPHDEDLMEFYILQTAKLERANIRALCAQKNQEFGHIEYEQFMNSDGSQDVRTVWIKGEGQKQLNEKREELKRRVTETECSKERYKFDLEKLGEAESYFENLRLAHYLESLRIKNEDNSPYKDFPVLFERYLITKLLGKGNILFLLCPF